MNLRLNFSISSSSIPGVPDLGGKELAGANNSAANALVSACRSVFREFRMPNCDPVRPM